MYSLNFISNVNVLEMGSKLIARTWKSDNIILLKLIEH
jgi:hypothetical protein